MRKISVMMTEPYSPLQCAALFIDRLIRQTDAPDLSRRIIERRGGFTYQQGFLLRGVQEVYKRTGDARYGAYIKDWVASVTDENGIPHTENSGWLSKQSLDFRQPGRILYELYRETGDESYRSAVVYLMDDLKEQYPKTPQGGFYHATYNSCEMWLDGLYMVGPLGVRYAQMIGDAELLDLFVNQIFIMYENMKDPQTGLLRHAWDESRQAPWSDRKTGLSPIVWGRAEGWFATAVMEMYEALPETYARRTQLETLIRTLLTDILRYQDTGGRFYQILDRPDDKRNWLDNSGTFLILNGVAKAVTCGILDQSAAEDCWRGFTSAVRDSMRITNDQFDIYDICSGTCVGDYDYYIHRNKVVNDYHGTGGFLLLCASMEDMINKLETGVQA